jgi:23S rRNA-/tRNA-specific pseudouridylate synthase
MGPTLLELDLKSGRTHQIRVHCAALHHPVIGDPLYGGRHNTVIDVGSGSKKRSVKNCAADAACVALGLHPSR